MSTPVSTGIPPSPSLEKGISSYHPLVQDCITNIENLMKRNQSSVKIEQNIMTFNDFTCIYPEEIEAIIHFIKKEEIVELNFIGSVFGRITWKYFMKFLSNNNTITGLKFVACKLTEEHLKCFAENTESLKLRLVKLEISSQAITEDQVSALLPFLLNNYSLKCLNLGNTSLSAEGLHELLKALKENQTLEGLWLTNNHLNDFSGIEIGHFLRNHPSLRQLGLCSNDFTDITGMTLALALRGRPLPRVDLGLEYVNLSGAGARYLLTHAKTLEKVGLRGNATLRDPAVLEKALKRSFLTKISLDETGLQGEEIVEHFKAKKFKINPTKELEISFSQSSFRGKSIEAFKELFQGTLVKVIVKGGYEEEKNPVIAAIMKELEASEKPSQELLNKIREITDLVVQNRLFQTFMAKQFKFVSIDRDNHCFFNGVVKSLGKITFRSIFQNYVELHKEDLEGLNGPHCLILRDMIAYYIEHHSETFSLYLEKDLETYLDEIKDTLWGGEIEIMALIGIFEELKYPCSITVYDMKHSEVKDDKIIMPVHMTRKPNLEKETVHHIKLCFEQDKEQAHYDLLLDQ